MKKIEFVTNTLGEGDWVKVFVDGHRWTQGHDMSLFDVQQLLQYLGHDVEIVELTNFELENYEARG